MNPFSLIDKHILVTGASSGIGRQCAISCSQLGAKISLVARNEQRLVETAEALKGTEHIMLQEDISIDDNIDTLVGKSVSELGKIDGFIHAAGIEGTVPLVQLNKQKYSAYFDINVIAGFEFAKIISKKKYVKSEGGSFVFLASVMGTLGEPGKIAYCASKGAVVNGVKALALELSKKKIRANCISPGIVKSPMTENIFSALPVESIKALELAHPIGFGNVNDIANAAIFLLSEAGRWVTGTNLIVDGGYSAK